MTAHSNQERNLSKCRVAKWCRAAAAHIMRTSRRLLPLLLDVCTAKANTSMRLIWTGSGASSRVPVMGLIFRVSGSLWNVIIHCPLWGMQRSILFRLQPSRRNFLGATITFHNPVHISAAWGYSVQGGVALRIGGDVVVRRDARSSHGWVGGKPRAHRAHASPALTHAPTYAPRRRPKTDPPPTHRRRPGAGRPTARSETASARGGGRRYDDAGQERWVDEERARCSQGWGRGSSDFEFSDFDTMDAE